MTEEVLRARGSLTILYFVLSTAQDTQCTSAMVICMTQCDVLNRLKDAEKNK